MASFGKNCNMAIYQVVVVLTSPIIDTSHDPFLCFLAKVLAIFILNWKLSFPAKILTMSTSIPDNLPSTGLKKLYGGNPSTDWSIKVLPSNRPFCSQHSFCKFEVLIPNLKKNLHHYTIPTSGSLLFDFLVYHMNRIHMFLVFLETKYCLYSIVWTISKRTLFTFYDNPF